VGDEDEFRALPLFSCGGHLLLLNLELLEVWDLVDNDPHQTAAKVDELVHDEAHDTSREDIISDVCVPRSPHALEVVEVNIVL